MYIYMHMYVQIHIYIYIHICICIYNMSMYMYIYIPVHIVYLYILTYIYLCMYMYVQILDWCFKIKKWLIHISNVRNKRAHPLHATLRKHPPKYRTNTHPLSHTHAHTHRFRLGSSHPDFRCAHRNWPLRRCTFLASTEHTRYILKYSHTYTTHTHRFGLGSSNSEFRRAISWLSRRSPWSPARVGYHACYWHTHWCWYTYVCVVVVCCSGVLQWCVAVGCCSGWAAMRVTGTRTGDDTNVCVLQWCVAVVCCSGVLQ